MAESPGGVEEGRVSIRVVPDTADFAADLRLALDRATADVTASIPVTLDTTGLDERARLVGDEAQEAIGRIDIKTDIDTDQIGELDAGLESAEASSGGLLSNLFSMPALIAVIAAAAAAIAPAFALVIPVIAGLGTVIGAIALGFHGLQSAFEPLIKGVSSLKKPISDLISQGLTPLVKAIAPNVVYALGQALQFGAQLINQVAKAFLSLGADTRFLNDFGQLMAQGALAFEPLVKTIPIVSKALVAIGIAALPALKEVTVGFAQVLTDFATSVTALAKSGQLTSIIKNSVSALSALGGVGGTVLSALLKIGVALAPAFTAIFRALGPVISVLGGELGKELSALAPSFAALATVLGGALVGVLRLTAPLMIALAQAVNAVVVPALATLAPMLTTAFAALTPLAAQVTAFFKANQTAALIFGAALLAIVSPVAAVVAGIVLLLAHFATVKAFVTSTLVPAFARVVTAIQPIITAFAGVITAAVGLVRTITPIVIQIVAVFSQYWPQIRAVIVQVFSTVQSIVVAALTIISAAIRTETAVIGFVWAHFGSIMLSTIRTVFPAMLQIITGVLQVIQGIVKVITDAIHGNWSGVWKDMGEIVKGATNIIQGTLKEGLGLLKGIAEVAVHAVVLVFKALGSDVKTAVGDIASTMESIGKDIVSGIVKGIGSVAGSITNALKTAVSDAKKGVEGAFHINSPSKVFADDIGRWLVLGIAQGIDANAPAVNTSLVKAVRPDGLSSITAGTASASGAGLPPVLFTGPVGMTPDQVAKKITDKQRDALTVYGLTSALAGA